MLNDDTTREPEANERLALAPCDLSAPFEAAVPAFTGSMDADGLTFSADGLTAYISGAGPGGRDIYVATRTSPEGTFGTPSLVTAVNTSSIERTPALSPEGRLFFTKQAGGLDIGGAVGTAPQFTGAQVVTSVSSGQQDEDPFWWGNNTIYFVSERPLGDHRDVWVANWNGIDFATPTKIPGPVNSDSEEFHPVVSPDGLTIYFSSRRHGIGGDGGGDIWMAKRPTLGDQFSNVVNLASMNSSGVDFPVTISADGCTLYFASNEETGLGASTNYRLYQATRGASTPAQVMLRLNILGTGSVNYAPFSCGTGNTGTCSASAAPDTTMVLWASGPAQWTGSCTGNGGTPSTDGVVVFSNNAVCTIKFPDGDLVGPGGLCSLPMDCQQGLECRNFQCLAPCPPETLDDANPCTADTCDPALGATHTPLPAGTSCADADPSNGTETCDGAGNCQPGTPVTCTPNGVRDTAGGNEECDDEAGANPDLCTATCQVTDALAVRGPAAGQSRHLGESRHPVSAGPRGFGVAFVEPDPAPPVIGLSVFDTAGDPRARLVLSNGSTPVLFSSPAVEALDDGSYAAVWTDFGRDGDALGIALRRARPNPVSGGTPPVSGADHGASFSPLQFANEVRSFSQYDADLLRVGSQLVVAWTDTSNASTGPDIRYRTFQVGSAGSLSRFRAQTAEQTLAATAELEGNVALAPFAATWAAAWRASSGDAEETIEVALPSQGLRWSIGPDLAGAPEDRPAIVELDAEHLGVLYTVGTTPEGAGVDSVPRLRLAILSLCDPEPIAIFDLAPEDSAYANPLVAQSHPSFVRAGSVLYAAWRTASLLGSSEAENVFLRKLTWDGGVLSAFDEHRIPRLSSGSAGDQRFPALAAGPPQLGSTALPNPAPQGALVIAWDDYGRQFGTAQGRPDVLVQHWPLPVLRLGESSQATELLDVQSSCSAGAPSPEVP